MQNSSNSGSKRAARTAIYAGALVVLAGSGLFFFARQERTEIAPVLSLSEPGSQDSGSAEAELAIEDAGESVDLETALARVSRPETLTVIEPEAAYVPDASELPQPEIVGTDGLRFRGDQILATVNGAAVLGKDLAPLPRDKWSTELTMSREMYAHRLQLGIERELTFQLAKSEGLVLSDLQIEQLERLRTSRAHDEAVIDPIGDPAANIEFDVRQAEARLFEGMLLENDGVPGPHVTEEAVEQYYVEHGTDFDPLPEDRIDLAATWQVISFDIRQILSTDVLAEYQEQRTRFYEDRLADADVEIYLFSEPL